MRVKVLVLQLFLLANVSQAEGLIEKLNAIAQKQNPKCLLLLAKEFERSPPSHLLHLQSLLVEMHFQTITHVMQNTATLNTMANSIGTFDLVVMLAPGTESEIQIGTVAQPYSTLSILSDCSFLDQLLANDGALLLFTPYSHKQLASWMTDYIAPTVSVFGFLFDTSSLSLDYATGLDGSLIDLQFSENANGTTLLPNPLSIPDILLDFLTLVSDMQ